MGLRQNSKFKERNWTDQALRMALEKRSKEKVSLRKLSKIYRIPKSTLAGYINGESKIDYRYGGHSILTSEEENIIAEWLKLMARKGYPRSGAQACIMAKNILDSRERTTLFKDNLPKKNWWYAFLRRHQNFEVKRLNQVAEAKTAKDHPFVFQEIYGLHLEFCQAWGVSLPAEVDEKSITPTRGSIFVAIERDSEDCTGPTDESDNAITVCESILNAGKFLHSDNTEPSEYVTEEIVENDGVSVSVTEEQAIAETLINVRHFNTGKVITERIESSGIQSGRIDSSRSNASATDSSQSDASNSMEIQRSLMALESVIPQDKLELFHSLFYGAECNDPLYISWKTLKEAAMK